MKTSIPETSMLKSRSPRLLAMSLLAWAFHFKETAWAMPQDSTAYYRIRGWSMPGTGSSEYVNLVGLGSVTSTSIYSYNSIIYSNGTPVNVDPLIRVSGHFTTNHRDRGGAETVSNQMVIALSPHWAWTSPRSHAPGVPGRGLFFLTNYSGNSTQRGWIKVAYNPGSVSAATLSQPFAVRTSAIPIGTHAEQHIYDMKFGELGYSPATRIPLAEMGINSNRVLFLQAIHMNDDVTNIKPFHQPPMGPGGTGSAFSIRGKNFEFHINGGPSTSGTMYNVNRGYINVDHIAAECNDGPGPMATSTNVGSRQVTAFTWNGSDHVSTSTYQGCHGHANGTYVIENTGDNIWTEGTTYDKFRFAHNGYSGNRNFICRVDQLENTNAWARAGLMIRTGTGPGDPNVGVFVTPGNGIIFQYRNSTNGTSHAVATVAGIKAPIWLRLEYKDSITRAYRSTNGTSWTQIGNGFSRTFSGTYRAGLAAAGRSAVPNTSVFSNLRNF